MPGKFEVLDIHDRVYFPVGYLSPPDLSIQSQRYYRRLFVEMVHVNDKHPKPINDTDLGKRRHCFVRLCEFRRWGVDNLEMEEVQWGLDLQIIKSQQVWAKICISMYKCHLFCY